MSLNFGAASSYIEFSIGNVANLGNGAFTILSLHKFSANHGGVGGFNSGTERQAVLIDTAHIFGTNDFSSGFGTLSGTDWYWYGLSKPSGSAHYRAHLRNYTTSGAWSHGEAVGAANHTDPGTSNAIRVGAAGTTAATGDVAVAAIWTSVIADATLETYATSNLSDLIAGSPGWATRYMNSAPTSIQDLIGTGHESTRTGTITNSADPPGYNFTLGGGGAPKNGQFMVFF